MKGVCRRYVSDEQVVDDVLHDAFVIIFTSFDRLRDNRKAESWMMSITRNVASKYKDHLKSLSFVPLEEAESLVDPIEEITVKGVPLEEVLKLIDKLPKGYGKVFRLSVFEGLSHKEIADMLGIEPHSSSSQLARAKKILRKMMQQYWAAMLLLLLMPLTFFLFRKGDTAVKEEKPAIAKQKDTSKQNTQTKESSEEHPQEPIIIHIPGHHTPIDILQPVIAQALDTIMPDSLTNMIAQEQTIPDTIQSDTAHIVGKQNLPHYDITDLLPDKPVTRPHSNQKWSIVLAYAGGMGEQNFNRPYSFTETPTLAPISGEPPSPVTFENWSDYAAFLSEEPDDGSSHSRSVIMNIALNNAGDAAGTGTDKIVRKSHHYMPINFSLALKYRLNNSFGLETGVSYSRLKSEFVMGSNGNTINELQTIHYLGIPVKGTYNIYNRRMWSIYGGLGVTMEIPVYSQFNTSYYLNGILEATDKSTIRAPWQWSVGTGFGLQYNFTPNIGLFAEPSLQYHIPTGTQIETYRTEHPFNFSLPLGIRFTW
jgi:RNA polymerase sigma-70 factor (ECF subfamily)